MDRIFVGLTFCGLLTLLNIYTMDSQSLPSENVKGQMQLAASIIIDTVAEISGNKKNPPLIKSPEEALTLSRFEKEGKVHTLAVLEDDGETLKGVDLSVALSRYDRNSFDVVKDMEFNEIVKLIHECSTTVTVTYKELLPCVAGEEHLAIGINYAEHGKETGQVRPFMFPKFVATDPAVHCLNYEKGWLLDYEVELGVVFASPVCLYADVEHLKIGFLVVNDFTDRATLMRKMDSQNVTGGKGFPDAKSKVGFLPTGPYMVIPRDWRAFVQELQLQLSVNGEQRQRGSAKDMVWKIDEIIERSLSVKGKYCSYYQDKIVTLFQGDCIPSNSIIITGTPAGTAFNAPKRSFIFSTLIKYICTGRFFSTKMHPYILQQYLKKQMKNPYYLKPGDQVESSISYLGTIKTKVQ